MGASGMRLARLFREKKRKLSALPPRLKMSKRLEVNMASKLRSFRPALKNLTKSWLLNAITVPRLKRIALFWPVTLRILVGVSLRLAPTHALRLNLTRNVKLSLPSLRVILRRLTLLTRELLLLSAQSITTPWPNWENRLTI